MNIVKFTPIYMSIYRTAPRCFPTVSALRACQLVSYEIYLYTESRIGILEFVTVSSRNIYGLETYIVPGQMFTTWVSFRYKLVRTIYTIAGH